MALEVALEVGVLTQMSSTMLRRGGAVDTWRSGERANKMQLFRLG